MKKSFWFVISAISLVVLPGNLFAAVTDWHDPGGCGDCSATGWTDPWNACDGVDNDWATVPIYDPPSGPSTNECFYNFGFTFPDNSTIDGIEIAVYCKPGSSSGFVTSVFRLAWASCPECLTCNCNGLYCVQKNENTQMTMNWSWYITPGGSTDKWDRTSWTPSELSDTNFRLAIQSTTEDQTVLVDSVKVRVYYTPPPTPTPTNQVCNPSFETPTPTCWNKEVTEDDAESMIDLNNTERAHSGSKSCKYDNPTANYFARDIRSDYISVSPGDTWDFACYYYLNQDMPESSASDTHVRFRIEWWDSSNNSLTPNWYPTGDTGINCANFGSWNAITYSDVTIPTGAATMTLRAFCREVVNNNNDLWLDDFSAVKQEE